MNISIKEHIINNFKNDNENDIIDAISESVENDDEITLPGLGVFMTLLWEKSSEEERKNIAKKIKEALS